LLTAKPSIVCDVNSLGNFSLLQDKIHLASCNFVASRNYSFCEVIINLSCSNC
jgi:hypothetical protein